VTVPAATMSIFISGMWLGWPGSEVGKFVKHEMDLLRCDHGRAVVDAGHDGPEAQYRGAMAAVHRHVGAEHGPSAGRHGHGHVAHGGARVPG